METPKKRPSIKGKKKVGSADLARTEPQADAPEAAKGLEREEPTSLGDAPDFSAEAGSWKPRRVARPNAKPLQEDVNGEDAEKVDDQVGPSDEKADARPSSRKLRKPNASALKGRGSKMGLIAGAVLAVLVLAGAFFVWNSYFRYDDAADIKGEWLVSDGSMVVVIDEKSIKMPDASYDYTLDDTKKTITFTFAELSGGGAYDFSDGRKTLTVSEGQDDVVVTTFYKMSDKTEAKPRKLSGEKAEQALSTYGPQEHVAVPAEEDASEQGQRANASQNNTDKPGKGKNASKDAS